MSKIQKEWSWGISLFVFITSTLLGLPQSTSAAVDHVLVISVDGLRGDLLRDRMTASPSSFPAFHRLVREGSSTFNARCDVTYSATNPNHVTMVTGRPVTRQPDSKWLTRGQGHFFRTEATSSETIYYQWYRNGTPITSATNKTHYVQYLSSQDTGTYHARVVSESGSVATRTVYLKPINPAIVWTYTDPVTEFTGGSVTFSVDVIGLKPYTYQWRFNGTNIPGATDSRLTLNNLVPSQTGDYSVIVSNPGGSTLSHSMLLLVL